eukprot:CAMPEP_0173088780 /NCGR_PEP_ID=MMETSP1102-20130122/25277_1 /TAXON_ID=49646 /ORGANISM="Geminigera sp., Strain Caron Lab Isolate" /LENGTH=82 /DNA_ID=CAMNT_0013972027 /DNA_START=146 /DNA_END=394 /DNA_ORIENTATION=+
MSIGFGFPSQDDMCYRDQDVASGTDVFKFSNAKYYVKGKHAFKVSAEGTGARPDYRKFQMDFIFEMPFFWKKRQGDRGIAAE